MRLSLLLPLLVVASAYAQVNTDLVNPSILTEAFLKQITKREIGQKHFAIQSYGHKGRNASRTFNSPQAAGASAGSRDIQESDVFKIGKKGKKELFLLNNYRGFQVVSFEAGLDKPSLVSRLPIYNNYSSEMYYLEQEDKVLVLNTEYQNNGGNYYSNNNYITTVYLIDVADTSAPKIVMEQTVYGYLTNSRLVGDVLYTVTSNNNYSQMTAEITSLKLKGPELEKIDSQALQSGNKYVRNMNVLKEGNEYYVISTLTDWRSQGDIINVHNITSAEGKIEKTMTAQARGQILERSQAFFHKNHLFAVSNFTNEEVENSVAKISVEAFPIKASQKVAVSASNMRVTFGDTNGQHASLQDVRVSGDLLYTFWVPANNIDPFDLLDISNPSQGIKHLGQLQFDGWISKAFPIEHNGKKFVLGLGWVVPATSETNKRYPQAKLFEIKNEGGVVSHSVVASLTLDSEDVWASLNGEDKTFEVMEDTPGVYNILFPVSFSKNWKSGAKIVKADLNTKLLEEGASIVADQGWLNRVFVNREVNAINTFSDEALATFDRNDIAGNNFAKTVSTLELARNIVDFQVISETLGMQIISSDGMVQLRTVDIKKADSEKNEIAGDLLIKGDYKWHAVRGGKLYVITTVNKKITQTYGESSWESDVFDYANMNVVDLKDFSATSEKIDMVVPLNQYFYFDVQSTSTANMDVFKIGGEFFQLTDKSLKQFSADATCGTFFTKNSYSTSLETVGNDFYIYTTVEVTPSDFKPAENEYSQVYAMPYMKKLSFNGNIISCSSAVNVPGKPALIKDNFLVSGGTESYYGRRYINYSYGQSRGGSYRDSSKTFSLKMNSTSEVEIVDILNKNITSSVIKNGFFTYSPNESRVDLWGISKAGEFYSRPQYLDYESNSSNFIAVKELNGVNFLFMQNDKKVDLYKIADNKRLTQVNITTPHDLNKEDGSAEYVFAIESITPSLDFSKFFISQGMYGVTELIVK